MPFADGPMRDADGLGNAVDGVAVTEVDYRRGVIGARHEVSGGNEFY